MLRCTSTKPEVALPGANGAQDFAVSPAFSRSTGATRTSPQDLRTHHQPLAGRRGSIRWHTDVMTAEQLLERISIDTDVCHGQPCIRGTRVLVTVLLDAIAAGMTPAEVVEHYPTVTEEDVRAAAAYGAWLAKQEIHTLSHGT